MRCVHWRRAADRAPIWPMSNLARQFAIETVEGAASRPRTDVIAIEEPLEIRVCLPGEKSSDQVIAVTMRTPGNDAELVAGYLFNEGIIRASGDLLSVRPCGNTGNVVRAALRAGLAVDFKRIERNFYTSSSCGVCGKTSIEAAMNAVALAQIPFGTTVSIDIISQLPNAMRAAQATFATTGGLHAAAMFSLSGELRSLREDVGRHNAMDKLIGANLADAPAPLRAAIILLSGRASFELIQKAMAAGAPVVAAIGAPSSLAIELAQQANITLIGFLRERSFNVYTHAMRLAQPDACL